ncbi:PSD1 and planctomycete cytochrome C domain-containing protein [Pirellulaceae bacterium]|nr:PSD1 and planctomycete cytochrome C domain-containing protein [Pirellulaceae bacterium]
MISRFLISVLVATAVQSASASHAEDSIVFSRDVQPLLAKHCILCHGPDEAEGGLRLDIAKEAFKKLESGKTAIVPNDSRSSGLLHRITSSDESDRMPPEGDPLTPKQIDVLRRWIQGGAKYEKHWAYKPIQLPTVPEVASESWPLNEIDHFVLAKLESKQIKPSPAAQRATQMKRLHYDLIGLPPTPSEVSDFLADQSTNAYEALVDRLLVSKHFGERWGRHWLDKARYADSDGYEKDRPRPNAWRYRDWVIDAINRDMPFDQFTVQQLAGDLLAEPSKMQLLATAFHRQTLTNTEGGTDKEQFRVEATFDRTETTAAVWLGLTMTCARCHSHKYDQITQKEYYQLYGFFNDANETATNVSQSHEAVVRYEQAKAKHDEKTGKLETQFALAKANLKRRIKDWEDQLAEKLNEATPLRTHPLRLHSNKTSSGAKLEVQKDGSILVSGITADKDKYTLVFEAPGASVTGLQLEVLTNKRLPKSGPGRAPNGNFVLSEVRSYVSSEPKFKKHQQITFAAAEADFAQTKFSAVGVLSKTVKSGWAISPKMAQPHQLIIFAEKPVSVEGDQFIQVVLDQNYGGAHTIGCFRIQAISGYDPIRSLPVNVKSIVRAGREKRTAAEQEIIDNYVASISPETKAISSELANHKKNAPKSPEMSVRVIGPAQRTTKVLRRGDFLQPEKEVSNAAVKVIDSSHPLKPRATGKRADRLDLARWLTDPSHPLTPRVTVNHVWAKLFGRGIVATVNDFGVRGDHPTHAALLDWLAWKFPRDMGWSRRALIKTIVMSATYRQSSRHRPELNEVDPTNLLLSRQNRVRVEAEIIRDLHLAASGLLSTKIGGPSVFPPLPPGVTELSYANNFKWATSKDEDRYRRGIYTFFKRTSPHPTLISFDCPDSNTTNLSRDQSNTPLQALAMMNNEVFTEAAQSLAKRILEHGGNNNRQRLQFAMLLCIARKPSDFEQKQFSMLLEKARSFYEKHSDDAEKLTARHAAPNAKSSDNAAWVIVARAILNLDEFIVRD